jgi:hypothetical protein
MSSRANPARLKYADVGAIIISRDPAGRRARPDDLSTE